MSGRLAALVGVAALLVGCSDGGRSEVSPADDNERAILATVNGLNKARTAGNSGCEFLSARALKTIGGSDRPEENAERCRTLTPQPDPKAGERVVTDIEVNGDRATATLASAENETTTVRLVEEGGWKVERE